MRTIRNVGWFVITVSCLALLAGTGSSDRDTGLVGHWKLQGDCQDYSGRDNHGTNHRVNLETGEFNGRNSYIEVRDGPAFQLATGEFSISAWICIGKELTDVTGDVVSKYDPELRKGFHLTISGNTSGYNSTSDARYVCFSLDDGTVGEWIDCGRPGGKTHNSDALTVFRGDLYVGITDAPAVEDWAHVFRYRGGQEWEDCGRVGTGQTRGVYAMIVHDDALYAATSASHGPQPPTMDYGRVYRYKGGVEWEDLGQPGNNYRLNSLASFQGRLYVCGFNIGPEPGHCYVYEGEKQWRACGEFNGWPHTLAVHDSRLYTAYPKGEVFAYDGIRWESLGNPYGSLDECSQIHSLGVYQGELHAGTWPKGKVAVLRDGEWVDRGRLGDATEVIAFATYNGTLYAGTIPRAEVFRFDGDRGWRSMRRLFNPPAFEPVPVGSNDAKGVADWSRATSLTVFRDRLFASTGTCYRTKIDAPLADEVRGRVVAFKVGESVSSERDLGPGWKHIVAIRDRKELRLYADGKLVASEAASHGLDVSNRAPLRIGFGQQSHFHGKIRDVRLYHRALEETEIRSLSRDTNILQDRTLP